MSDQRRFAVRHPCRPWQGTRMRSDTHKVLHPIASRPLLLHLLDRVDALGADKRVVVVGKGREQVERRSPGATSRSPSRPSRRAPATRSSRPLSALAGYDGPVLILYGDTPFVEAETLRRMLDRLDGDGGPGVVVLASQPGRPAKYGRIILGEGDRIAKMVEYRDATEEERAVRCATRA
jgi:bifunctional UDP-N-acetylglucosamine pyrophosphorylase/glucosamine-1-phosphate N-acetyltransferase